jgi:hypothetical protein
MKKSLIVLISIFMMLTFMSGTCLDAQGSKEKMAYNNFMRELKASNMMEGKVGNLKYKGNEIHLDFTDPAMPREEMEKVLGHIVTMYANNNNSAQTGITMLKVFGYKGGTAVLKVVYNAGPSHDVAQNLVFTWLDGSGAPTGGATPPPASSTPPPIGNSPAPGSPSGENTGGK